MDSEGLFLRLDEWSGKIQRKLDDNRASVDAINTLMVVAAFIAGVQAQIISFTLQLPQSTLGRITNFFAFLGLILEISGTFLGAIHTLLLQRRIQDVSYIVNSMAQCKSDLKIIIKEIQRQEKNKLERNLDPSTESHSEAQQPPQNIFQIRNCSFFGGFALHGNAFNSISTVQEVDDFEARAMNVSKILEGMDSRYKELAPPHIVDKISELVGKVLTTTKEAGPVSHQETTLTVRHINPIMRFVVTYGNIPLMSMAGGVACLALSTILLSAASQILKPEIWITCLVALLGVIALSFLPTSSFILKLFAIRHGKHSLSDDTP